MHISSASDQVALGSEQVASSSMMLSQGATEQASSVDELSGAMEEILILTSENAKATEAVQSSSKKAHALAADGSEFMEKLKGSMDDIYESSEHISKIIKVIDDIAFQTNILALNAAVEAARAGDSGKGFAVVAEEVRNLASRSAEAAKQTEGLIGIAFDKVKDGAVITEETMKKFSQIVEVVNEIGLQVKAITSSSTKQSASVNRVNSGIEEIASVVKLTSENAEETAASSQELSGQAGGLIEEISRFKF